MKVKKLNRRFITLVEIMIVMILIALITGVLAVNFRGSLEEGKVFKTKAGIDKLEAVLNLEAAKNPGLMDNITDRDVWQKVVRNSPLVQNPGDLIKDGWGQEYEVLLESDGRIKVSSRGLEKHEKIIR
ncbi:MAG: type II secretion system protein [Parachlamydiaceae bacterium]